MPLKITRHARMKPEIDDGIRILITRYWLRGLSRDSVDCWMQQLAPSKGLWSEYFDMDFSKAEEKDQVEYHAGWGARYVEEMREHRGDIARLRQHNQQGGTISLLCACHHPRFCHRKILKDLIEDPDF